jgi:hypothetical protein
MTPEAKAEINRANAQHSTGPKSDEGKQRCKYNARKHNLTGQTLVSTEEDLKNYFDCSAKLVAALRPEGDYELRLAHSLADAQWQLDRARAIETNLLFQLSAPHLPEETTEGDFAQAQAKAFMENSKQLDLMSRYATRYHRQVLQLHATLASVQNERHKFQEDRHKERQQKQHDAWANRLISETSPNKQTAVAVAGSVSQNPEINFRSGAPKIDPSIEWGQKELRIEKRLAEISR